MLLNMKIAESRSARPSRVLEVEVLAVRGEEVARAGRIQDGSPPGAISPATQEERRRQPRDGDEEAAYDV
jgi:hypothetical protein